MSASPSPEREFNGLELNVLCLKLEFIRVSKRERDVREKRGELLGTNEDENREHKQKELGYVLLFITITTQEDIGQKSLKKLKGIKEERLSRPKKGRTRSGMIR